MLVRSAYVHLLALVMMAFSWTPCADAEVRCEITWTATAMPLLLGYGPLSPSVPQVVYLTSWGGGTLDNTFLDYCTPGRYRFVIENYPGSPKFTATFKIYNDIKIVQSGTIDVPAAPSTPPLFKESQGVEDWYDMPNPVQIPPRGSAHVSDKTHDPVSYVNGEIFLSHDDLLSGAAGVWGHTRSYSNNPTRTDGMPVPHGQGWFVNQIPFLNVFWNADSEAYDSDYLTDTGLLDNIMIDFDGNTAKVFQPLDPTNAMGTQYILVGDGEDTLTPEEIDGTPYLVYLDSAGNETIFSSIAPSSTRGYFLSYIDAAGNETDATYSGDRVSQISRTIASGVQEIFSYAYITDSDIIASASRQTISGGVTTTHRQALYDYFPIDSTISPEGDLERVTIEDGSGNIIDRVYYRYYFGTEITNCYEHALKYVINEREYDLMVGAGLDPMTATDAQIANYASHYFEYDRTSQMVTKHTIQGSGEDNGGTFTYSYVKNTTTTDFGLPQTWYLKTTETLPDGNETIVYSNHDMEVLLKAVYDVSASSYTSVTAYTYDDYHRMSSEIDGTAIASFNDEYDDLGIELVSSGGRIVNQTYASLGSNAFGMQTSDLINSKTITDASGTLSLPLSSTTYIVHSQFNSTTDTSWVDDATPTGAIDSYTDGGADQAWIWEGPSYSLVAPYHGTLAHQSADLAGFHQHYFFDATATMNPATGDDIFTYVYLDPASPPTEIMFQFFDGSGWEHRACWGADDIAAGTVGTVSHCYEGALPATGGWVRLEIPAADVGLEGVTVSGMAFDLYDGHVTFDYTGLHHSGSDTAWFDDSLPTGSYATGTYENWSWLGGVAPTPESGSWCDRVLEATGLHQNYFYGVSTPLAIVAGDILSCYVYLDPNTPPDEIMFQFYDGSGWEHRVYWGTDDITGYTRFYGGTLPATGEWVKLTVSAEDVGLVGLNLSGMTYTLYNGQAWFDNVRKTSYFSSGPEVYLVASHTAYRDSSSTGALTTTYDYTFFPDTFGIASVVTTLPVISTAEHGTGTGISTIQTFDAFGRLEWLCDQDGFLHYSAHDPFSGAVTTHIDDVDTSLTSYFTDLPTGWSTPITGGLNIMSVCTVDPFGRPTSVTDPNGNLTYQTYDDQNHEMRTYAGWQTSTSTPTLPTVVMREDRANGYEETLTMATTPICSDGVPTGTESIGSLRSLHREYYDAGYRITAIDSYASVSGLTYSTSSSIGTLGTNYYRKTLGYDSRNNTGRTINEVGTITRQVFDSANRIISIWIGTNDTPTSGDWSPTNNTGSANMVDVEDRQYDIDGDLTTTTAHPTGSPSDDRVTEHWFDFADRCIATKSGVQSTESTGVGRLLTVESLDDRGLPTSTATYAADNVTMSLTDGVWSVPSETQLVAYSTAAYDAMGQCYTATTDGVDPSSGSVSSTGLKMDAWFDGKGLLIKKQVPGGVVTKNQWDGNGRLVQISTTDGGGDSSWSDAGNETGDAVLHQVLQTFDANGNIIKVTTKDRFDSETATGDLGNISTAPLARVSYQTQYVDAVNRPTALVDVGTNGGTSYTRPSSAPSRSPTARVTSNTYNDAGLLSTTTDPRDITTGFVYDARNLRTAVIEAFDASIDSGLPSGSNNRTTITSYDGIGHPLSVTASMPSGSTSQTTGYTYAATTGSGSVVNSNDLLTTIAYPDPSTGSASTSSTHQQVFTYNGLGQRATVTDGNGSVHTYAFDVMGRQLSDAVTTLGTSVDGSVRLITTTYNPQGQAYLFTSYNAVSAGSVVNQVQRTYNDLGQIVVEYQAPTGSVDTDTSANVQWTYTDMGSGVNNSRLTNLTYPNGRVLDYHYTTGIDDSLSRISYLADNEGSSSEVHLEEYSYLGLQKVVLQHHPEPGFDYTLIKQGSETAGDAGDVYTGLDRFGQLADCRWLTTSTGTAIDRFQYGYDNVGNVLYENNKISSSFSSLYGANAVATQAVYDPLNRMTSFARGTLSASGSNTTTLGAPYVTPILDTVETVNHPSSSHPVSGEQSWTFDQLGNWSSVVTDGTTDTRTHNAQNQVTATSDFSSIGYDNNGNVTSQTGYSTNVWDAWNRGIGIRGSTFSYDALGRRVTETDSTDSQYFYYAGQQMIENSPQSGATVRHQQFVYGLDYIDHVILRDRDAYSASDTGSLGGEGSGLEERLYYTHNRQFSVTGLISQTGTMVERTIYDPYGESQYFSASYASPTATSSYANNVSFTGRWIDPTGELYFRARYYDPELGRFIGRDPLSYIDGMSMYQFCRGNAGLWDSLGLCADNNSHSYWWDAFAQIWSQDARDRLNDNFDYTLKAVGPDGVQHAMDQANRWSTGILVAPIAAPILVDLGIAGVGTVVSDIRGVYSAAQTLGIQNAYYGLNPVNAMAYASIGEGIAYGFAGGGISPSPTSSVLSEVESTLSRDSGTLPTLTFDYSTHPGISDNIWQAQMAGHPDILTQGGDAAANRAAALSDVPNISPLSRDEYPFASSTQGGAGAWVGHVPQSEQNSQGGIMSNFFSAE